MGAAKSDDNQERAQVHGVHQVAAATLTLGNLPDLSFLKDTRLHEKLNLQFRVEQFNVLTGQVSTRQMSWSSRRLEFLRRPE
jgi:hypothetical protein